MEIFRSLNDRTEVLESLDWNEESLAQLENFIIMQNECFVPTHPTKLLLEIEEFFGESTRIVMEKIMKREYAQLTEGSKNYEN